VVASANPGCEIQLRGQLGSKFRIAHPIELYLEAIEGDDFRTIVRRVETPS
jgi:Fe-S oxidoreductase